MKKSDLEKVKGRYSLVTNGEYIILYDTKLQIFKTDGSFVALRTGIGRIGRTVFLSGNRLLLCTSKRIFHLIDLASGEDLWIAPYVKCDLNVFPIAISPDEQYAYTYDRRNGNPFISRLDLTTQEVVTHFFNPDIGATWDIICDEDGIPCLLKALAETIGGKVFQQNGSRMHDFYGISPESITSWKAKWQFEGFRSGQSYLGDTDHIITSDLHLFQPSTGELINLLENETDWTWSPLSPSELWPDTTGRYLCLKYTEANVILDMQEKKVVAQYAAKYAQGCLLGDSYWICVDGRVQKKPFPAMEEAAPEPTIKALHRWSESYYSKRPERW